MQIRAGVTRQRILVAATELFEDVGYGNTSLSDIVAHSHLSKGAFYYHFQSKESVAAALIKEADAALAARFYGTMNAPSPTLENLIAATFGAAALMHGDSRARIGFRLHLALDQISHSGDLAFGRRRAEFIAAIALAIADGDLDDDVDATELGHTLWTSILGTHLLETACHDDIFPRLAQLWRTLLHGRTPAKADTYFVKFIARQQQQHQPRPANRMTEVDPVLPPTSPTSIPA